MESKNIISFAVRRILQRDIRVVAGGVSFFVLLSLFPLASVSTTMFGLIGRQGPTNPDLLRSILPSPVDEFLVTQLDTLTAAPPAHLSLHLFFGIVVGFFSAMSAAKVLIEGLHVVTGKQTAPSIIHYQSLSAFITLAMLFLLFAFSIAFLALSASLDSAPLAKAHAYIGTAILIGGKFILGLMVLGFLYLTILPRTEIHFRSNLVGAAVGAAAWVITLVLFNLYLRHNDLSTIYGAISSVIVFLLWLYLSTYALLLGAIVSSRLGAP